MKILKKAEQQNVKLNTYYYNRKDIDELKSLGIVTDLKEMFTDVFAKEELVIFTEQLEEIKVVLDEFGSYTNIAITKDDRRIFIEL
ncbi:hypothetical protein [Amedibacterium intestinale]|uniref:hypothetical protein n=1 Tax=Amedibacterium intestinale TaxID=2583452 RepID=UPI000E2062AC